MLEIKATTTRLAYVSRRADEGKDWRWSFDFTAMLTWIELTRTEMTRRWHAHTMKYISVQSAIPNSSRWQWRLISSFSGTFNYSHINILAFSFAEIWNLNGRWMLSRRCRSNSQLKMSHWITWAFTVKKKRFNVGTNQPLPNRINTVNSVQYSAFLVCLFFKQFSMFYSFFADNHNNLYGGSIKIL